MVPHCGCCVLRDKACFVLYWGHVGPPVIFSRWQACLIRPGLLLSPSIPACVCQQLDVAGFADHMPWCCVFTLSFRPIAGTWTGAVPWCCEVGGGGGGLCERECWVRPPQRNVGKPCYVRHGGCWSLLQASVCTSLPALLYPPLWSPCPQAPPSSSLSRTPCQSCLLVLSFPLVSHSLWEFPSVPLSSL